MTGVRRDLGRSNDLRASGVGGNCFSPDKDIRMGLSKSKQYCDPLLPSLIYVIDCQWLNTALATPSHGGGGIAGLSRKTQIDLDAGRFCLQAYPVQVRPATITAGFDD